MNKILKAHLALLGANLFYGAGFTVAKTVMPEKIQPLGFIFIRVSIVTALFWLTYAGGRTFRTTISKKDWPILVLGGLFGVALNQMLFFLGLNRTLPIHASLIMMSTPLLITVIAAFVLRERLRSDKVIGLAAGVSGAALLMSSGKNIMADGASATGDLLVLLNAASYAIYLVIIKPLMQRYRPIIVIRWVFLFGLLFTVPFCWNDFMGIDWTMFRTEDYYAVAFIVVCCTFFTYLWNVYALQILSPAAAGGYIYLQPVFAAVVSMIFLDEALTGVKLASALLIFCGVYLVNFGLPERMKNFRLRRN